jgi:predicted metal-dependent HD superfamily phosphohydrolase
VSYDDFLLVSAGEDGSVVMLDIRDKELAKASSRQQQVRNRQAGWQQVKAVCTATGRTAVLPTWTDRQGLYHCNNVKY